MKNISGFNVFIVSIMLKKFDFCEFCVLLKSTYKRHFSGHLWSVAPAEYKNVSILAANIFQIFQRHHYAAQRAEEDMELFLKSTNLCV